MSSVQRIIKYCAIAFAMFLIFTIVSAIMGCVISLGNIFDDNKDITEKLEGLDIGSSASILNVDVSSVNVIIKESDTLRAETNNKSIKVKQDGNKLIITSKKDNWFHTNKTSDLIIYVPTDLVFDGVTVETGAGNLNIEKLATRVFDLDMGAGKAEINNLFISESADIDGGAGEMIIDNSEINNLDLDMGVGRLSLTSKILGMSEIDSGVGEVNLNLVGVDDYKLNLDKGVGSITIDGTDVGNHTSYGSGINTIQVDGGVGAIKVSFID